MLLLSFSFFIFRLSIVLYKFVHGKTSAGQLITAGCKLLPMSHCRTSSIPR